MGPLGRASDRTKLAAAAATPARTEGWYRGIVWPVDIDRALVTAVLAGDEQAADAVLAHAAERHRADWFVIPSHTSKLRTDKEPDQGCCHDESEPVPTIEASCLAGT
jgi:hypothetical protein